MECELGNYMAFSLLLRPRFPVTAKLFPVIFGRGNRQKPASMLHYSMM
jgi:hypothetical protein